MKVAVYPGSFDPITFGHLDILGRAADVFDRVVVGVLANPRKAPLLAADRRITIIRAAVDEHCHVAASRIAVEAFNGLTVDFCRIQGAQFIIRGLRAISDFEFEFQMALLNRKLESNVETIFLMPKEEYTYLSSRIVKEISRLGGDVSGFVPAAVAKALRQKMTKHE